MTKKKQVFVSEQGVLKKTLKVIFLSYKIPLFDRNESVVGILGLSFTRAPESHCPCTQLEQDFNYCPQTKHENKALSQMEEACMRSLCRGLTAKQIARHLNLSPRTVETYLEREKLNITAAIKRN